MIFASEIRPVCDSLRHSSLVREVAGWVTWARAALPQSPASRSAHLCRALDLAESADLESRVLHQLAPVLRDGGHWRQVVAGLPRYRRLVPEQPGLSRSILLKAPGAAGEKGALLLYFEYNWARLLLGLTTAELDWLGRHYDLILAASWSPTDYATLALAAAILPDGAWIQPANQGEAGKIGALHPQLRVLDSLACDWINPVFYHPKPMAERSIDLLMIANWGAFKRHWEFFEALRSLPAGLRVVLIGQKEGGRTLETIRQEAARARMPQRLEFHESLPIDEVTRLQCDAKVSVLMSRREGGCVAVVESLFAGAAVAMRADAHVGSRAHIHPETGALLRPGRIAGDLAELLARAPSLRPHDWAARHLSCHQTVARLNATLKTHALAAGRTWSQDLCLVHWRPYANFADPADRERLRPAYADLHQRFPRVFPANLADESWR